jgi:hypothetical protein
MSAIVPSSGTYTVAPGTPISALSPVNTTVLDPTTLFFAGANGEIFELRALLSGWAATTLAPAGTLPTAPHNSISRPFVSAIARFDFEAPNVNHREYDVFASDTHGHIQWYSATDGAPPFSNSVVTSSSVEPGTQIAVLSRAPGQMDIFAADGTGAIQSYWWNFFNLPGTWFQVTNLLPPGTTTRGAGVAATGWQDQMDVCTTTAGSNVGLTCTSFEQGTGWSAPQFFAMGFTAGIPLQGVSPNRERHDIFGLEADGHVDWHPFSTQFLGLPFTSPECTDPIDACTGFSWTIQ